MRNIDRVLVNGARLHSFPSSHACFLPPGVSDHSPMLTSIILTTVIKSPFKFFKFWTTHPQFLSIMAEVWETHVVDCALYRLAKKLKLLKQSLRQMNEMHFHDISKRTSETRCWLESVQALLEEDPSNEGLGVEENEALQKFMTLRDQEESFYKQKSRVKWLKEGDANTRYFHQLVKGRHNTNRINALMDDDGGLLTDAGLISERIVDYYTQLFTTADQAQAPGVDTMASLLNKHLNSEQIAQLSAAVTREEVKETTLASNKSPCPDGYSAEFFRAAWRIVEEDVYSAVIEFFSNGRMLKQFNNAIIVLIRKCSNPSSMQDFRPISCCNTIYKCISKILASRMVGVLPGLSAFVHGRRITDNILLTQELMKGYHLSPYLSRCTIKVDLRKAYDMVEWECVINILKANEGISLVTSVR